MYLYALKGRYMLLYAIKHDLINNLMIFFENVQNFEMHNLNIGVYLNSKVLM